MGFDVAHCTDNYVRKQDINFLEFLLQDGIYCKTNKFSISCNFYRLVFSESILCSENIL